MTLGLKRMRSILNVNTEYCDYVGKNNAFTVNVRSIA